MERSQGHTEGGGPLGLWTPRLTGDHEWYTNRQALGQEAAERGEGQDGMGLGSCFHIGSTYLPP